MTRLTRTGGQCYDCCDVCSDGSQCYDCCDMCYDGHQHKVKKRQDKLKSEMSGYADNAESLLAEMMNLAEQMTGSKKSMIQKLISTAAQNIEMVKKML